MTWIYRKIISKIQETLIKLKTEKESLHVYAKNNKANFLMHQFISITQCKIYFCNAHSILGEKRLFMNRVVGLRLRKNKSNRVFERCISGTN